MFVLLNWIVDGGGRFFSESRSSHGEALMPCAF